MTGAARFLNNLYGNLIGNVTGNVNGNVTGNVTGNLTGTADQADKLTTARLISVDVSKASSNGTSFNGTQAVDIGVKNQLAVGNGGTGASTLTSKGILYGNGTSAIGATTAGTSGQLLKSQGTSGPTWENQSNITAGKATKLSIPQLISVDVSKAASSGTSFDGSAAVDIGVKNQLGVGNGGTGVSTLTSKGILYGNGASAIGATTAGTSGQLLKSQGSSGPTWVSQSEIIAGKASVLQTSRTISLTGAVTGSTTFNGGANASITTSLSLATGDTSGHVKIAGTNVKVKDINNSAYKDFDSKPTYGSVNLITSGGVNSRIAYQKFTLSDDEWSIATYTDGTFGTTGIYRQAISFAGFTANTQIVSIKLVGSQSGTQDNGVFYDSQFSLINEAETGDSLIEFRATTKPTLQLTVVVGYVSETLNTSNTSTGLPTNSRFSADQSA